MYSVTIRNVGFSFINQDVHPWGAIARAKTRVRDSKMKDELDKRDQGRKLKRLDLMYLRRRPQSALGRPICPVGDIIFRTLVTES